MSLTGTNNGAGILVRDTGNQLLDPVYNATPNPALGKSMACQRTYSASQVAAGTYTMHEMRRAPGKYLGFQVTVHGPNSGANTIEVGVASAAQFGDGLTPLDAAGAAILPTQQTIGSTNIDDFSNPGGGSTLTGQITDDSGSGGTRKEGSITFDWCMQPSLDRVDVPGDNPIYAIRIYGVNPPAWNQSESSSASGNPFSRAFVNGEFKSGFWTTKQVVTNTGGAFSQGWLPSYSIRFLLAGQKMNTILVSGDSLDQGDQPGTVSPWGGTINGWGRKLVALMNGGGIPTSYLCGAKTGSPSFLFHEIARKHIVAKRCTHLFLRPHSANDFALGAQGVADALTRTSQLLALADANGIAATLIEPGPMGAQFETFAATVRAYCAAAEANGRKVLRLSSVLASASGGSAVIDSRFISDVDALHLNEAGHTAIAAYAYANRASFGF